MHSTNSPADTTIVAFQAEYRSDFERLNRIWLEEHSLLERADLEYLQDPEEQILAHGGQVFFALRSGEVVGTCAVIPEPNDVIELMKIAVAPAHRGRGIGRQLAYTALEFARGRGAKEVVLTSNSSLTAAIALYESLGFEHAPMPVAVRYETANVCMRLSLRDRAAIAQGNH